MTKPTPTAAGFALTLYSKVLVAGAGVCVITAPIIPGLPNQVRVKAADGTLYTLDKNQVTPWRLRLVCSDGRRVEG